MSKNLIVTVYTINGDKTFSMPDDQIMQLAHLLQTEKEPVPMYTETEQLYAVGMMIQGRTFTDYPRAIIVTTRKDEEE